MTLLDAHAATGAPGQGTGAVDAGRSPRRMTAPRQQGPGARAQPDASGSFVQQQGVALSRKRCLRCGALLLTSCSACARGPRAQSGLLAYRCAATRGIQEAGSTGSASVQHYRCSVHRMPVKMSRSSRMHTCCLLHCSSTAKQAGHHPSEMLSTCAQVLVWQGLWIAPLRLVGVSTARPVYMRPE